MDAGAVILKTVVARATQWNLDVTHEAVVRLVQYWELLAKWNRHANLTGLPLRGVPLPSVDRLLMEPLVAGSLLPQTPQRWFDLGSGGGSPAIPMKIVRPALALAMVESRGRKCAFLREVVHALSLSQTSVLADRIEKIPAENDGSADLVTVRALRFDGDVAQRGTAILKLGGRLMVFATETLPDVPSSRFSHKRSLPLPLSNSWLHIFEKAGG